jgi:hypothetical protein
MAKFESSKPNLAIRWTPEVGVAKPIGLKDMEAPGRVELPTNGLGNRCSIQLSYGPFSLPFSTDTQTFVHPKFCVDPYLIPAIVITNNLHPENRSLGNRCSIHLSYGANAT